MADIRFDPDRQGIAELLKLPGVQADLHARADRVRQVADAAGQQTSDGPLPIVVDSQTGRKRARAAVIANHPAGIAIELKHRLLGRSLDAAG